MPHTPRPMLSQQGGLCPACGTTIRKGRDRVMLRFRYKDWVHANRMCLYSKMLYDSNGELLSVDLAPGNAPVDERLVNPF